MADGGTVPIPSGANALLVIVIGLLILWLGITGKFGCFSGTLNCMLQKPGQPADNKTSGTPATPGQTTIDRVLSKTGAQYQFPGLLETLTGNG